MLQASCFIALLTFSRGAAFAQQAPAAQPDRVSELESRISRLENVFGNSQSAFNPAMGAALDTVFRRQNSKANFDFRAAEVNVESPIDPYLRGWVVITGSNGSPAVDVEEAALQTTALPYNLTVTGGRLFASFGRLAHFHDHELPVIFRPRSLDTFIGAETRADGVEVNYLLPTPFYANVVFGLYDKMGADNGRQYPAGERSMNEFTYLARLSGYTDLTDNHSIELGVDSAWTPSRSVASAAGVMQRMNTWRALSGIDLTYRYNPVRGGLYSGVNWGTEVMVNNERRFSPDCTAPCSTALPTDRVKAFGGFSYVEAKLGRQVRVGAMVDLSEDLDVARKLTRTFTGYVTGNVTEFQRLRLQYSRAADNAAGTRANHTVALQWTGVFGHHVHGFRDR